MAQIAEAHLFPSPLLFDTYSHGSHWHWQGHPEVTASSEHLGKEPGTQTGLPFIPWPRKITQKGATFSYRWTNLKIQLNQENPLYLQTGLLVRSANESFSSPADISPRKLSNFIQYLKFSNQLSRWMELKAYYITFKKWQLQIVDQEKKREDDRLGIRIQEELGYPISNCFACPCTHL